MEENEEIEKKRKLYDNLYRTYYAEVLNYAKKLTTNYEIAKDIVQDTLLKIFEKSDSKDLDNPEKLVKYWKVSIKNKWIDELKRKEVRNEEKIDEEAEDKYKDQSEIIENQILKIDFENFLYNLSEKERDLYRVHYLETHSEEEEREILGLKKTMVRKELTKLNKVIKEFLNDHKNK